MANLLLIRDLCERNKIKIRELASRIGKDESSIQSMIRTGSTNTKTLEAIAEVFEGHRPYVTSTKSMTGHEMWMAGASEVIYSTLMMQNNFIAPNLNFEEPDEASAQLNIPAQRVNMEFDTFLSNSFGFGGTNSTLIIKKVK